MSWRRSLSLFPPAGASLFLLILVVGAFLRLETIGDRPLWADEIFTARVASQARGPADVWIAAGADHSANPPAHLLASWVAVRFSDRVSVFRAPSALAGLLALALTMAVAVKLFDRRTGLAAGALMALSVYQINYAQDGRPYAFLLAFTLAQALALILYLERPRRRFLVAFSLAGVLGLYTHHLAAITQLFLAGFAGSWWWASARDGPVRGEAAKDSDSVRDAPAIFGPREAISLAVAYAVTFVLFVPQLFHVLDYLGSPNLGGQTATLAPGPRFLHQLFARWGAGTGWVSAVYDLCLVVGLVSLLRGRWLAWILIPWLVGPFLLFSVVPFDKFFDIRFLIQAYPAFAILVARGLVSIADRASAGVGSLLGWWSGRSGRARDAVLVGLLVVVALPNFAAYRVFRETPLRCSDYYRQPRILHANGGFCREHIILSTVIPADRFMIRGGSAPGAGAGGGTRGDHGVPTRYAPPPSY